MKVLFSKSIGLVLVSSSLSAAHYYCDTCDPARQIKLNPDQADISAESKDSPYYTYQKEDQQLLNKIQNTLDKDSPDQRFKNINITVNKRNVYLSGTIDSEQSHQLLREKLNNVEGILKISDQIDVGDTVGDLTPAKRNKMPMSSSTEIDRQLTLKAQNSLRGGKLSKGYDNVTVYVRHGIATVTGSIEKESEQNDILKRIQDIDGIQDVENHLSLNASERSLTDSQLALKARETLKGGVISRGYDNINVNVRNGKATIKGNVATASEQADIIKRIQDIDGIKDIENLITIKKKALPNSRG